MALQSTENGSWLDSFIGSGSTDSSEQLALSEEALWLVVGDFISSTSSAAATATSLGESFNWPGLSALRSVN